MISTSSSPQHAAPPQRAQRAELTRRPPRAKIDDRGYTAVVYASGDGPHVHFQSGGWSSTGSYASRVLDALRTVAHVYATTEGNDTSWPRAVWVQERPGQWVRA